MKKSSIIIILLVVSLLLLGCSNSKNTVVSNGQKVNTSKIGVIGHSQGGRSAVNAGAMDDRINCVISLAGSNYVEEAEKLLPEKAVFANRISLMKSERIEGVLRYTEIYSRNLL